MLIEEQAREMEDALALSLEAAAARGFTEAPGLPSPSQRGPSKTFGYALRKHVE